MSPAEGQALQDAINVLSIEDVCVRALHARLEPEFEPSYDTALERLEIAMKHVVTRFEVVEFENSTAESVRRYRVFIDLGVRWRRPNETGVAESRDQGHAEPGGTYISVGEDDPNAVATIEAEMMAEYAMAEDPGSDALDVFARRNASFHVWPYWRELVSSQCSRMNLPKVALPMRQVAANANEPVQQ